jgi:hypothetical protein
VPLPSRPSIQDRIDAWLDHARVERHLPHAILIVTTLALLASVYVLVWTTGGARGPYLHAVYLPVLLAAVTGGVRAAAITGMVATVMTGPLMPLDVDQGLRQAAGAWLFRGAFFLLIGIFAALATASLRSRSAHNLQLREDLAATYSRNLQVFAGLVASRDEQTYDHCDRVGRNAVTIGRRLDLDRHALGQLYWSGILHDLGKIGTPEAILRKPAALTDEELVKVQEHCELGRTILMNISPDYATIASGVIAHHERWDGTGYPYGLTGEEIPLFGRILAVADVFEALTSYRPYRDPLPVEEALAVLRDGRGGHFDPSVVDAFLAVHREGLVAMEADPFPVPEVVADTELVPELVGRDLIAARAPWRARVVN